MAEIEEWRRVHLRTPRPRTPRWAAPAAAAAIVLTAVALWTQFAGRRQGVVAEPAARAPTSPTAPQTASSRPAGIVVAAGARWQVGRGDDQVVEGDWDCDGRATLALLRPATGDVYRFDTWTTGDVAVQGRPIAKVPGARALRAGDLDGDRCDELLADGERGTTAVSPR